MIPNAASLHNGIILFSSGDSIFPTNISPISFCIWSSLPRAMSYTLPLYGSSSLLIIVQRALMIWINDSSSHHKMSGSLNPKTVGSLAKLIRRLPAFVATLHVSSTCMFLDLSAAILRASRHSPMEMESSIAWVASIARCWELFEPPCHYIMWVWRGDMPAETPQCFSFSLNL